MTFQPGTDSFASSSLAWWGLGRQQKKSYQPCMPFLISHRKETFNFFQLTGWTEAGIDYNFMLNMFLMLADVSTSPFSYHRNVFMKLLLASVGWNNRS